MPQPPTDGGGPVAGLWGNPAYRTFLGIQTLSALGDSFSYVALPLLVLHSTGSLLQMGLVTALTGAASILTGLFAGVVVDRFDRRRLLMLADAARCLLYLLIPLAWAFATPVWLIYAVVPLAGCFSMLFQVTYVTVVPSIVRPDQITKANGHMYATYAVAGVAGPALAGFVASVAGPAAAIGIDAATFAVSAVGIFFVRFDGRPSSSGAAQRGNVRQEFLAGAKFLFAHPVLRPLTLLLSLLTFLIYGLTDLVIYLIKHELHHPDTTVGYVLTAGTVGSFIASAAVARVRKRLGFGVAWVGAFVVAGFAIAGIGVAGSVPVIAVLMAVTMMCTGIAGICSMSLRQEVTPAHLLGRVTSAFWTIHNSLGPVGAGVATAAAGGLGVTGVCLGIGAAVLVIALSGTLTGIRTGGRPAPGADAGPPAPGSAPVAAESRPEGRTPPA
ncbi:MFS transporter [Streptomyces sp. A7024]|uniref:MFS transporter n=1 Tax=Streptomyces coryli TaxID=1128680 RepID=A0A6G4UAX9_9ACTN|nr:MFS transporter [Streptomyces coryli]NGN68836.1 MFS transporter [Streptomyces coryli]